MTNTTSYGKRISSIDLLRGLVMIIMALDHSRDMIHYSAIRNWNPLDLHTTTPWIFMTRWITHFCAPIFVFLSGTSIFLYRAKGRSKKQVGFFLLTRGIFLMLLEILVIGPTWAFGYNLIFLQVIWAIGLSMVILAALQFLPYRVLLALGILIILGHNLLDPIEIKSPMPAAIAWSVVHYSEGYQLGHHVLLVIAYPFLPWLGLMILGYCCGKLYLPSFSPLHRKKVLFGLGVLSIILFISFRWLNFYGDPRPWSAQKNLLYAIFDFIKLVKYPPSMLFILMTIGPGLIFLSLAERPVNKIGEIIIVYGKVPLFYYILHGALIHLLSFAIFFLSGHHWSELDFGHYRDANMPEGAGSPLWVVYIVWALTILILYFPCKWYGNYKSAHRTWWLSYL